MKTLLKLRLLVGALVLAGSLFSATPFDDPDDGKSLPPLDPKKPNLLVLMKDAGVVTDWEKQWQASPGEEGNELAKAGLQVALKLTRSEQVAQAKDPRIGGGREDLLLTMDVARHELLKHALKLAIKSANQELSAAGQKQIGKVMVSNCSPLGDGTRDGDLTVEAEDDVREAALFRHLAEYFDKLANPNLSTKLSALEKGQGRAFSVEGLEISFHRGQNDVPPPHVPMDLMNFSLKYRRNIERQYENPEAYLGFGAEQEVQGRRSLRLAGKKPAQVLVQTFSVGGDGGVGYSANRFTNQKQALDALRTTLGPDYTQAHNAMHAFCDFIQASHHQHETEQDISKGPIKYAERALNAICRLHGFDEWKKLPEKSRAQVLQLALGPGFGNQDQLQKLAGTLNGVFGKSGTKVGDSTESALAMSFLRRASARALQEVARVMMDPPPIRPKNIEPERWNALNRQEQEQLARTDPEYSKRISVAAMENLVIATRLLAQIDMETAKHGPATPFGTAALRRVIEESQGNPRLQRVLQLAADHAQADAGIERNCPPGMDAKAWKARRLELVKERDRLRFELSQECAAFRDSPERASVERAMKMKPGDLLKRSGLNLIPPDLVPLQGKRAGHAQLAMGGDDPLPPLQRAKQFGKNAAGLAFSHVADPNNLPDMLNLVEMVQDGAGAKDYARLMISTVAGRYNPVVGYSVGVTEISMIQDPAEQERQLAQMGKGVVFDILSRYIPGVAQAKLAFDIEKGIVNVTYGYAIKSLNADLVDALYMGEAGRVGPGRAGTLSGWVRDAVEPVLPETYVVHSKDAAGKERVDVDCVRLYKESFKSWTGRSNEELGRITELKPKMLSLVRAHDRVVNLLEARAEGMDAGWFGEYTVGLYQESDLDAAIRELISQLEPLVRSQVNETLNSVSQVREYTETRNGRTVNLIEEGLVGRLSGDFVAGLQSEWNSLFMQQRQLKRNLDGLMSTAVTQSLAQELARPELRTVAGKALPAFEIEVQARTPDGSLAFELDGNRPLPLVCQLKAAGQMPDNVPAVQMVLQTGDMIPVPASYRPFKNLPAGDFDFEEAARDASLWSNGVFRQPLTVQAVVVAGGQVLAEKKVEVLVRFTAQSGMKLVPAAVEGLVKQPIEFTVKGSALPGRPRFEWTMGDGSVKNSYEPKISHTYYKEGDFKVTVKLFDGSQVYVGGRKAPVLAECSGSARISKDERLLHYITYWDNEQKRPQQEYYYREGERGQHLKEGDEKRWYENGQLSGRVPWVKGVPNGNIEMFYENGKPQSTGTVLNGKINGLGTEYYEEGGKKEEGQIIDDTKVGKWTYWDQYGRIVKTENRNAKGQEHGTTKEWYTVGTAEGGRGSIYLGRVIEYVNGESVHITSYREDGSVEREWRK